MASALPSWTSTARPSSTSSHPDLAAARQVISVTPAPPGRAAAGPADHCVSKHPLSGVQRHAITGTVKAVAPDAGTLQGATRAAGQRRAGDDDPNAGLPAQDAVAAVGGPFGRQAVDEAAVPAAEALQGTALVGAGQV